MGKETQTNEGVFKIISGEDTVILQRKLNQFKNDYYVTIISHTTVISFTTNTYNTIILKLKRR